MHEIFLIYVRLYEYTLITIIVIPAYNYGSEYVQFAILVIRILFYHKLSKFKKQTPVKMRDELIKYPCKL